jgi:DHA1 family bicyclomycin/chloramphenicol resistance-like MFS transporter
MKRAGWLPILLGFLTAVGPVSTDMYLPAFPQLERDLHGAPGSAQITLAAWFIGLAIGQMTQGSLSDRFGRRMPLLAGTAVYTFASAGCALAPDIPIFSAFRVLAALGGSASAVIPRAMVRDLADGHAAARMLSTLILIMGVVPILAPAAGGAVLAFASWRIIFWAAAIYGLVAMALVYWVLPDTLPKERRIVLGFGGLLQRYALVASERTFLTHALQASLAMGAMFIYLGGSPTVFIKEYHLTPTQYGMLFGLNASGFIGGSQVSSRVLPRLGANRMLHGTMIMLLTAVLVLTFDAFTRFGGLLGMIIPLFITLGCMGLMMPVAAVSALSPHANHAGSASALMGTWQFSIAALAGFSIGAADDGTARPMAVLMLACVLAGGVADLCRPKPRSTQ